MSRPMIMQHRLREIERPFGWIPLRLLRDGTWETLSAQGKILHPSALHRQRSARHQFLR